MQLLGNSLELIRQPAVAAGGGAPPSGPLDVSGLVGWWDASAMSMSEGQDVSEWTDMSGNGRNFDTSRASPSKSYPKWRTVGGANNAPYMSWSDGNEGQMVLTTGLPAMTAAHMFAVVRSSLNFPVEDVDFLWKWGSDALNHTKYRDNGSSEVLSDDFSNARKNTGLWGENLSLWARIEIISTATEWTAYHTNTSKYTTGTNTFSRISTPILGGYNAPNFATPFQGGFSEIILYNAKLSSGDQTAIRSYLDDKYFP